MHGLDASPWAQTKTNSPEKDHWDKWFACGARKDGAYRRNTALRAYQRAKQDEAAKIEGFTSLAANLPAGGVFTAAELDKMNLPPVQWAVPGLLPAGLSFLVAAPKMGKSWMALDLCLAVASGGEWLGRKVNQGPTLYLDLEDSANRAQARMRTLLDGFTAAPETCTFRLLAPILGPDLFKILDEWVTANPGAKVVCIDTFQKSNQPPERMRLHTARTTGFVPPCKAGHSNTTFACCWCITPTKTRAPQIFLRASTVHKGLWDPPTLC